MEPSPPSATTAGALSPYIDGILKFPMLSAEAEQTLCCRWRDHHDISAAQRLAGSHLRLVVETAMDHRGYGLPLEELIGEGHMGLMRAVCRFDPDRGVRFSAYALWWVRAAIQGHILRNWSLVKMARTTSPKTLFFSLRRMHARLREFDDGSLRPKYVGRIANTLRVPEHEVIGTSRRVAAHNRGLDAPISVDGESGWQISPDNSDHKTELAAREDRADRKSLLPSALQ